VEGEENECSSCIGGTVRPTGISGFWYAYGSPGYLWDGEPTGPYATEEEALQAAREAAGYCPHGCADEDPCEECDPGVVIP
jgi:hypothetical protein